MKPRQSLILIILSLVVNLGIASFQSVPGYMDAEYYFLGGRQLAMGEGFWEPVIWNYLDDPEGLPHPSHAYWMPLASILSAVGMVLTGSLSFNMARLVFVAAASVIPLVTAYLSYHLTGKQNWAFASGFLAIFSGFYLPYGTTTDTFAPTMLIGGILILSLPKAFEQSRQATMLAGMLVGLLNLGRVDGIFWALVVVFFFLQREGITAKFWKHVGLFMLGYIVIMGPWFWRNMMVFGSPFAPGNGRTIWATNYDQIFTYPAEQLNFRNWWASGLWEILKGRGWALGINLQRILAEQGGIILLPFVIMGLWKLRSRTCVQVVFTVWLLTFGLMTIVFPFAGARGGLFHACAAMQPLFWALVPAGFNGFISWGAQKRGWEASKASRIFGVSGIVIMAVLSLVFVYNRVWGFGLYPQKWESKAYHYQEVEDRLQKLGAGREAIVMVNNPPGYNVVNNRPAIMIPEGDYETTLAVAERYNVTYLILEEAHVAGLIPVYEDPQGAWSGLIYLGGLDGTYLFEVR